LGKFRLLVKAIHQLVNKGFAIIYDDIPRHTILTNDVHSDKINQILLLDFLEGDHLYPFREIISGCQNVHVLNYDFEVSGSTTSSCMPRKARTL